MSGRPDPRAARAAMPTDLHIVASCTDRKRVPVPRELHLREVRDMEARARARAWWAHLWTQAHEQRTCVRELYAGDHWRVVQELPALAREARLRPHLWVASAGYGLLPAGAAVRPYSATFGRSHADSIARGATGRESVEAHRQWWRALSEERLPDSRAPRSLHHLVSPRAFAAPSVGVRPRGFANWCAPL